MPLLHGRRRPGKGRLTKLIIVGWLLGCLVTFLLIHSQEATPSAEVPSLLNPWPELQSHPLPSTLAQWSGSPPNDDYFDQIQAVNVGYLVWSRFPVQVFIEPLKPTEPAIPSAVQRSQAWIEAVQQAVQDWSAYLPLQVVSRADEADIAIWRVAPPLQILMEPGDPASPRPSARRQRLSLGRARAAETRFEIYPRSLSGHAPSRYQLAHRCKILLRPDQPLAYTLATARHELGHALGIWGHSPSETDTMFFSQVRTPPAISQRDINTLKRIYQQPTRLGWELP